MGKGHLVILGLAIKEPPRIKEHMVHCSWSIIVIDKADFIRTAIEKAKHVSVNGTEPQH